MIELEPLVSIVTLSEKLGEINILYIIKLEQGNFLVELNLMVEDYLKKVK